jgi:hypothetical protein
LENASWNTEVILMCIREIDWEDRNWIEVAQGVRLGSVCVVFCFVGLCSVFWARFCQVTLRYISYG